MGFLAIDPGEHAGWALLGDDLKLLGCGIGEYKTEYPILVVLCERPTVYPHSKASPDNIITLAITAGKLVRPWEDRGARIEWAEPRKWKGQISKNIHHPAILHSLSPVEQSIVAECLKGVRPKPREDAMDAVGLAVWGRRMKVFG